MSDLQDVFGQGGFVTSSVAPATDFSFVPPNKYPTVIETAEMKPTKAENGHYIELVLVIVEGEFQGRKIWDRINIDNPSQKCVEIGSSQLAALGLAIGIQNLTTVQQLANQSVVAHVKVKNEQNEVRTYSSMADYRSGQVATPATTTLATVIQPVQQTVQPRPVAQTVQQSMQPPVQQPQQQSIPCVPPPQQVPQQQPNHMVPQQGDTVPWARPAQ